MKERPILFNGEMVRAILDGSKTQTRRVIKPQPCAGVRRSPFIRSGLEDGHGRELRSPYGIPGDGLWVRETWQQPYSWPPYTPSAKVSPNYHMALYRAATAARDLWGQGYSFYWDDIPFWRSPIFMPRWASRIDLEVTGVLVEQATEPDDTKTYDTGDWVWVVEFQRVADG